ncbi:hypothetical protein EDWATA_01487 [Edwardsiella tarda ATCC 23685]|uniref:Uncharacterized protein n=1 Tax=Edwardsiella tarda ATCC 23685 TaxID=500638 RepID=D4F418_EDWTA|nr:hypothetical protein EDWATA_01487 [Edwardsiella tarda ATCC 23685]
MLSVIHPHVHNGDLYIKSTISGYVVRNDRGRHAPINICTVFRYLTETCAAA